MAVMPCQAMKISDYKINREIPKQRELINLYLNGYIVGLFQANDVSEARGSQKLFCMPDEELFRRDADHRVEFVDNIINPLGLNSPPLAA